ncbi:MAG TPA: N-formylglutamate amidohydrolase [Rhodobacterales bacterium]|nr:N-formylglutamate amidohydrolase [Rhodobacterales bacterium]
MAEAGSSSDAVKHVGTTGPAPVVILCEHASNAFPEPFGALGLEAEVRQSHVAWDPGALGIAERLSSTWNVPLVHAGVSRLIYDCNRPPDSPDAMPVKSEIFDIPGNRDLTPSERAQRVEGVYRPFVAAVDAAIEAAHPHALVTIHSFTPVYFGKQRSVEIGILYDEDALLAEALLAQDWNGYDVRGNEPYGPEDGVTHSLRLHAISRGLPNVMIEIRNDLLATPEGAEAVFVVLSRNLGAALAAIGVELGEVA